MVVMNHPLNQAWWYWIVISATRALKQEDHNFKARLGNLPAFASHVLGLKIFTTMFGLISLF